MSKELKKITEGTKKDREIKWFSELSDKRKSASCSYYNHFFSSIREKSFKLGNEELWCFSGYTTTTNESTRCLGLKLQ